MEHGAAAEAVDRALDALEGVQWRALFAAGVIPMALDDTLALLVREDGAWLIAGQTSVFTFDDAGRFDLVGAWDRIGWGFDTQNAAIHLFDGRSLLPP